MLSSANRDIAAGDYRPLDLTRPPFNLPATEVLVHFDGQHTHQVLHLAKP